MKTSTSTPFDIKLAVASDIHLNHPRTPTKKIVQNFNAAFPDNKETAALDLIVLAGDVFDSLVSMSSDDAIEAQGMIARLLFLCKRHDIILRVLDGTKSHDHFQSKIFESLNQQYGVGADVKYVKTLSIEYIEKLNINVLYVPDEWDNSTEKTLHQVKELMRSKGLEKLDFAFMHGQFEYQLPEVVKAPKHNSEEYSKLVEHYIFIGHVHNFSTYKNIIAQGSLDRLSHGEEGAKGHVRAHIVPGVSKSFKFIENTNARVYKTVNVIGMDIEDALDHIDHMVAHIPDDSAVRIEAEIDHPIFSNLDVLIAKYPYASWSKLTRSLDDEDDTRIEVEEDIYTPVTITRENIETLVVERISRTEPTERQLENCKRILRELM